MVGFIFGGDTKETPETLRRKREVAAALLGQSRTPRNVGEGLQAIGDALVYRSISADADKGEKAGLESANSAFSSLFSGGGETSPAASSIPMTGAASEIKPDGNGSYRDAIASIESDGSGGYSAVGPTHPQMGRALGRYQVMESNIGPWSKEALGREITADEFLAHPELQDAIFDKKFGGYVQQYGPQGAAQAWFAGPGGVGKLDRKDSLGTSVADYTNKFSRNLGTEVASAQPTTASDAIAAQAPQLPPVQAASRGPVQALTAPQPAAPQLPPPTTVAAPPAVASVPQVAQAAPQQQTPAQALAAGGPSMQQLIQASQNPFLSEGQRGVVGALLKQKLEEADPLRQLQIQQAQMELEQARAPKERKTTVINGRLVDTETGKEIANFPDEPKLPAGVQEYEYAKKQGFPGTYQDWEASKKGGMSLQVDPATGQVTFQQGSNIKPMTEAQSKDTTFATRAEGALPTIDQLGDSLTSLGETVGGSTPVIGNYMKSPEFQKAEQAGKEFLQAILRKDTGAAITKGETDEYGSVYLPRPGDSKELLEQKKTSRRRALEAMKAGMTPQAILAQEKALAAVPAPAATPAAPAPAENPLPPTPKTFPNAPPVGTVDDGYTFKGGDPTDPKNWAKEM